MKFSKQARYIKRQHSQTYLKMKNKSSSKIKMVIRVKPDARAKFHANHTLEINLWERKHSPWQYPLYEEAWEKRMVNIGHLITLEKTKGTIVMVYKRAANILLGLYLILTSRPQLYRDTRKLILADAYLQIFLTQQDYYGQRCGTLLHSYCTGTYTEVTVLLLWGNSAVTLRGYSKGAVELLQRSSTVTSV